MTQLRTALALLTLLLSTTPVHGAPQMPVDPEAAPAVRSASFGLTPLPREGAWRAAGPSYKADFDRCGVVFTNAVGASHREPVRLSLRILSFGREQGHRWNVGVGSAPLGSEDRVVYDRAGAVREVYDVRRDGVEQSFVFPERLSGSGDLVVRVGLDTDLAPALDADGRGLRLERPGVGGVRIGAVVGIAADGRRGDGVLRLDGEVLELVLPAAFIDTASYPLVLDPLIGPIVEVEVGTDSQTPDVAFDASTGHYLVVWVQVHSLFDRDLHGRLLDTSGAPIGSLIQIQTGGNYPGAPAVAAVCGSSHFLVAWQESVGFGTGIDVFLRAVGASDGAMAEPVQSLTTGLPGHVADSYENPDVGGAASPDDERAVVVWQSSTEGIVALGVRVTAAGNTIHSVGAREQVAPTVAENPSISPSDGRLGKYLVAWEDYGSGGGSHASVVAAGLDADGIPSGFTLDYFNFPDERSPSVAGGGEQFLVACAAGDPGDNGVDRIYAVAIRWPASVAFALGMPKGVLLPDVLERYGAPAACAVPGGYFVAAERKWPSDPYSMGVAEVDASGAIMGLPQVFGAGPDGANQWHPSLASPHQGDPFHLGGEALLVFEEDPLHFTKSDVLAQPLSAWGPGGTIAQLGGGCGGGGAIGTHNPAALGHPDFRITLSGADPMASAALLNLTVPGAQLVLCGGCTISAFDYLFGVPVTGGAADVRFAVPNKASLAGKSFGAQWMVGLTQASPCASILEVSFSDRMEVTLDY